MLHTRFNRAFRSVFRFVSDDFSDDFSDNFCIVCTQTAFFTEKLKALGDFQIIFNIIFASFVPDLIRAKSMYVYDAKLKNYRYVVLLVNVAAGHNRGPAQACGSV